MQNNASTTDDYIQHLPDWQQTNLKAFRDLILQADPEITEDIKWGVPVFTYKGKLLFAMASFKAHTKYNFIQNGAVLEDTDELFNNGFESKKSRGIDLQEGQTVDQTALTALIKQAIAQSSL